HGGWTCADGVRAPDCRAAAVLCAAQAAGHTAQGPGPEQQPGEYALGPDGIRAWRRAGRPAGAAPVCGRRSGAVFWSQAVFRAGWRRLLEYRGGWRRATWAVGVRASKQFGVVSRAGLAAGGGAGPCRPRTKDQGPRLAFVGLWSVVFGLSGRDRGLVLARGLARRAGRAGG